MVTDRLNPRCIKAFILGYKFPEAQPLKSVVCDVDNSVYGLRGRGRVAERHDAAWMAGGGVGVGLGGCDAPTNGTGTSGRRRSYRVARRST